MTARRVRVYDGKAELSRAVAARFLKRLRALLAEKDTVNIVLTGGTMGEAVLANVRELPAHANIEWSRVTFWWGDERYLASGDPERNETQSRRALLDHLPLPAENIKAFPAVGDYPTIEEAAAAFAETLAAAAPEGATFPTFDLTFLGVGGDGHIASLFPDHESLRDTEHTVLAETDSPKPPAERLTFTYPVINASDRVWLVMAGADKAGALGLALADANPNDVPVAGVSGRLRTVFFVDKDAAAEVPENLLVRERFWTAAHEIQG